MSGAVVGTVAYMAPEQARAEPVDQRADIYTLGLILYDLLLGRARASSAESAFDELNTRMVQSPPAPRTKDASIPEALDRIIARCIQPAADARYPTIAEMLADLEKLDDNGKPLPMVRRLTWRIGAAAALVVASLLGGTYWLARGPGVPVEHDPVSVLIADIQNGTGDPSFDRTLEPILKLAIEGAGFVSAYDRTGMARSLGVKPPEKMDERAAQEIAVRQGVNVVLSGSVDRQGSRYAVSVKATQAVTGQVIAAATDRTSNKAEVLKLAASLVEPVRKALGDTTTSDAAQRFALEALSATSLEAVHEYARGLEALSASRPEDALRNFSNAVERDPKFGGAYGAMAIASFNLDRRQDAVKYLKAALEHLDSMTERERYRTRGFYYLITDDYEACVKEYGDLIARYSADASARNNRSLCFSYLRNIPAALEETRQVVKILPNRTLYQQNLAQYLAYASDFPGAEGQARSIKQPGMFGLLALAFAQIGQGRVPDAEETYRALSALDDQGASYTASGLADVAAYEGRFSEAARVLRQGAAADLRVQGCRPGGRQVRRPGPCGAAAREEGRGHGRRREGAGQQSGRQDPLPRRAGAPRSRRDGESPGALPGARFRPAEGFPGIRQDSQRSAGAQTARRASGGSGPDRRQRPPRHVDRSVPTWDGRIWRPARSSRPTPRSSAASSAAAKPCRFSWTTSLRTSTSRRSTTTRAACGRH